MMQVYCFAGISPSCALSFAGRNSFVTYSAQHSTAQHSAYRSFELRVAYSLLRDAARSAACLLVETC